MFPMLGKGQLADGGQLLGEGVDEQIGEPSVLRIFAREI